MGVALGDFLRKLRLENCEIMRTLATRLGVSSAFLSAVENGKKKMPESWYEKLKELYDLDSLQMEKLQDAVLESSNILEINIQNASNADKQLAISFARKFESLDEETSKQIMNILNRGKEE